MKIACRHFGINRRSDLRPACETTRNSKIVTENIPYSIEDQPLNFDQRVWRWKVLTSTYFAYAGFYLVRKVFPLCKTTLADEYGIGFDGVANIWTAYLFGYMVGQFINSFIGRKWGPRALLLGGLGISIVINVIFGFANSYSTFLVFMLFNGLVQAAGWPGSVGGVGEADCFTDLFILARVLHSLAEACCPAIHEIPADQRRYHCVPSAPPERAPSGRNPAG